MTNLPDKRPQQSLAPRSEPVTILSPTTTLTPDTENAPVESYSAKWVKKANNDFYAKVRQELTFSGVAGGIMLLISAGLFIAEYAPLISLIPIALFVVVALTYYVYVLFRAPAMLDASKQSEIAELKDEINRLGKEHARELDDAINKQNTYFYKEVLPEETKKLKDKYEPEITTLSERCNVYEQNITELRRSLEEEQAKNARPEIVGTIQYFTIFPIFSRREDEATDSMIQEHMQTGFEVTLNVRFLNVRPTETTIKNFSLELKQTCTTHTAFYAQEELIQREIRGQSTEERLNNLADLVTQTIPIKYGHAVEGFLRFRFQSFIHTKYVTGDEFTLTLTDDFGGQHVLLYKEQEFTRPSQRLLAEQSEK